MTLTGLARLLLVLNGVLIVVVADPTRYGIPDPWRPYVALAALIVTVCVSELPPSVRGLVTKNNGKPDAPVPPGEPHG